MEFLKAYDQLEADAISIYGISLLDELETNGISSITQSITVLPLKF